jgi:hypothetical protein
MENPYTRRQLLIDTSPCFTRGAIQCRVRVTTATTTSASSLYGKKTEREKKRQELHKNFHY